MEINTARELSNTQQIVDFVLDQNKKARNDDIELIKSVWELQGLTFKIPDDVKPRLINPETITRAKRKIQNEYGRHKPVEQVEKNRRTREKDFREYYAKN